MRRCRPRTGHAILHTLYGRSEATGQILYRIFRDRLIMSDDGVCTGVVCWKLDDGTMHVFNAKICFGDGWLWPRLFQHHVRAHLLSDGGGMVARCWLAITGYGICSFHRLGIYGSGCLITEGARGERRLSDQLRGRKRFVALRAELQRPRTARFTSRCMTVVAKVAVWAAR
jgi:succinate dehydrogenase / fumarate reductase flavoprotein subunit